MRCCAGLDADAKRSRAIQWRRRVQRSPAGSARLDVLDEAAAVLMPWEALQTGNEEDCCTIMEETGLEEANPVLWTVCFCERISGSEQTIV